MARRPSLIDVARRVARNAVTRDTPAEEWIDGHPLGNGDLGVMATGGPEGFRYYLSKSDVWDNRTVADGGPAFPSQRFEELRQLVLAGRAEELRRINEVETVEYSRTNYPSPQTCGILNISHKHGPADQFSQVLDLYEGVDRVCWRTGAGTHRQAAFVHPHDNVTEIHIEHDDGAADEFELRLARDPSKYYPAEEALDGPEGFVGFTFTFPDGASFSPSTVPMVTSAMMRSTSPSASSSMSSSSSSSIASVMTSSMMPACRARSRNVLAA